MTEKLRRNRYRKDRRRWGRRLLLVGKLSALIIGLSAFSALFMAGYAAVTRSPYFNAQTIEVHGNVRLQPPEVIRCAGLHPGENLLAVNLHLARRRLLAHPWIAEARVIREIPETLRIEIREQQALAVIDLGRRFLLNREGRIFKEFEARENLELPLIGGIDYTDIALGDDTLSPALQAVVAVLAASRGPERALPYAAIAHVDFDREMGVTLSERGTQRKIMLGGAPFAAKYARLDQLYRYLADSHQWAAVKTVDLNHPDRVVVRLESVPVPAKARS